MATLSVFLTLFTILFTALPVHSAQTTSSTDSPTESPSFSPTSSPTQSPTRVPIASTRYDSYFTIAYLIKDLESKYVNLFDESLDSVTSDITEIIEQSYFETTGLDFYFFDLGILEVFGEDDNVDLDRDEILLESRVECESISCQVLQNSDFSDEFEGIAQAKLRTYFPVYMALNATQSQSELKFEIYSFGEIGNLYAEESVPLSDVLTENSTLTAIIIFMILMVITSFFAFIYNKRESSLFDESLWYAPILYGIQWADILTNIHLCTEILLYETFSIDLRVTVCAVASIISLVAAFGLNYYFGWKLVNKVNKYAQENVNAHIFFREQKTWNLFVGLFILSGGFYPVLFILSSSMFGLQMLNSGLCGYELRKMNRIKIFSIVLSNVPQICIQCVFAAVLHQFTLDISIAFITSVLSIICTPYLFSYRNANHTYFKYFIEIKRESTDSDTYNDEDTDALLERFLRHKGKTYKMSMILCQAFGYTAKDIEISRNSVLNESGDGVVLYVTHTINERFVNIFDIVKLYQEKQNFLKGQFQRHFELKKGCVILFKMASKDGVYANNKMDNFEELLKKSMDEKGLNYASTTEKKKYVNYLYGDEITGNGGEETRGNNIEMQGMTNAYYAQ